MQAVVFSIITIIIIFKITSPQSRNLELKAAHGSAQQLRRTNTSGSHSLSLTFPCSFKQKLQPRMSVRAPVWARARGFLLPLSRFVHLGNEEQVGAVQDFMRVRRHLRRAWLFISVGIDIRARE